MDGISGQQHRRSCEKLVDLGLLLQCPNRQQRIWRDCGTCKIRKEIVWLGCRLRVVMIIEPETNGGIIIPRVCHLNQKLEAGCKYCTHRGFSFDDESRNLEAAVKK